MSTSHFPATSPAVRFTTSQTLDFDVKDLYFKLPPGSTDVVIESSDALVSGVRAVFTTAPELPDPTPVSDETAIASLKPVATGLQGVCPQPIDISFNGGKIFDVRFDCDHVRNISFNGGNVEKISFGSPFSPVVVIEETEAGTSTMPSQTPLNHKLPTNSHHSLTIQIPSSQKTMGSLRLEGGAVLLQVPEDIMIKTLRIISTRGDSSLGAVRAGRVLLRIRGGTMEAGLIRCDDFKAVVQGGALSAPATERSSITLMSGSLDTSVAESATTRADLVVRAGEAKIELPGAYEGELNCDVASGRLLGNGQRLPNDYMQRAMEGRLACVNITVMSGLVDITKRRGADLVDSLQPLMDERIDEDVLGVESQAEQSY